MVSTKAPLEDYQVAEDAVTSAVEPILETLGYRLVRVRLRGTKTRTLQIMAECLDETPMTVDHCAKISRAVTDVFEDSDPVSGDYMLEVSSPGIDRPLVREDDFRKHIGFKVQIDMARPVEGRRRFKGILTGVAENVIRLSLEEGRMDKQLPLADVRDAKLVFDEALLAQDNARRH